MGCIATLLTLTSCATKNQLEPGETEIKAVNITADNDSVDTRRLATYVHQMPGMENGKRRHLAYDQTKTEASCRDLATAMNNEGYMHARVTAECAVIPKTKDKRNPKCVVNYRVESGTPYYIYSIRHDIQDERIDSLLNEGYTYSLQAGRQFSVAALNEERSGIVRYLQDRGYYKFNKDFIRYIADTIPGENSIRLTLTLIPYKANSRAEETRHPCYVINDITYSTGSPEYDIPLRASVLDENTIIQKGKPYSATALEKTYQRFARLQALKYTNIRFAETEDGSGQNLLDCDIQMSPRKPNSVSIQPEGTNTAGDFGAAVSLIFENRNLFHGSETFSLQLRGAYEAITGLEGYNNQDYIEYGIEGKLQFPRFLAPFISRTFKRSVISNSELSVAYNSQNRPEFHRRMFSSALKYNWSEPNHHTRYTFDLLDLNYIYMPWISETFKHDYLESTTSNNAILRYNYEDLFITKIGFGVAYNNGTDAVKFNFETAGNILNGIAKLASFSKNKDGQYTLFNIAYAQYVKGDVDATHITRIGTASELVMHGHLGIAYPYGNSSILPFEKRYFAGGSNSVRGWGVRELGPGAFVGTDGRIDFINQTGDIKLDLNIEYRTPLFWKLHGAAFVDAGNIWTVRNYESQPGGQFRFDSFYKQIAVGYGIGLRLNFGYFILRFDAGMKAVSPAYTDSREHYPILHPDFSRDFTFHFAVGMPF